MLKNKSLGLLQSQEILEYVKWSDVYHKSSHNIILQKITKLVKLSYPNNPIVNNVLYHFNVHTFKCVVYLFSSFSLRRVQKTNLEFSRFNPNSPPFPLK